MCFVTGPPDLGLKPLYDLRVNPPPCLPSPPLVPPSVRVSAEDSNVYISPRGDGGGGKADGGRDRDRRAEICSFSSWELYTRVDPFGQIAATNFKKNMSLPLLPFAVTSTLDNVLPPATPTTLRELGFAVAPCSEGER